jgi:serine/threonine protein phosphatase PrpC
MTGIHTPLRLRWATYRDRGQVREHNQDSVWASEGLLGVADGFGPRSAGAPDNVVCVVADVLPA